MSIAKKLSVLMTAIVHVCFVCQARAVTYHVADCDNIQTAIDMAADGDIIAVEPGEYNENIHFTGKDISIVGQNPDSTIIAGDNLSPVVTFDGDETAASISGFTITNTFGLVAHWKLDDLSVTAGNPDVYDSSFSEYDAEPAK